MSVGVELGHDGVVGTLVGVRWWWGVVPVVCPMPVGDFDLCDDGEVETDEMVVGGDVRVLTVWLLDGLPLLARPTTAPAIASTTTALLTE
jgi:hypothetical protein